MFEKRVGGPPSKYRKSFPLRLGETMRKEAAELAKRDETSLNHFINVAIAEKIERVRQLKGAAYPCT